MFVKNAVFPGVKKEIYMTNPILYPYSVNRQEVAEEVSIFDADETWDRVTFYDPDPLPETEGYSVPAEDGNYSYTYDGDETASVSGGAP